LWLGAGSAYNLTDGRVVARYVDLTLRRDSFLATLAAEGWTVTGSQGQDVQHPLARLVEGLEQKLQGLEDRLGLSPESRLRLGLSAVEGQSKLQAFLNS